MKSMMASNTATRVTRIKAGQRQTAMPSLRDQAYEAIKDRILTCRFRPGQTIDELSVADLLGFGRTPVHQALDRLHLEGLVSVIPRKGVVVTPVVATQILEMIEVRMINESHCASLAAERAEPGDIAGLLKTLEQAHKALKAEDVKMLMKCDRQFHMGLANAARNDMLAKIVTNLNERSLRFWFISFTSDHHLSFQEQHNQIFESVKAGKPAHAAKAMTRHLGSFKKSVLSQI